MKSKKIKLSELKVKSFITEESAAINGGKELISTKCGVAVLFTDKCKPSEGCEPSFEAHCAWTKGKYYCG